VIGGGITGLAAAWELRDRAEVTVVEPGRIGGRIRTTMFEGRPVDEGPDAFLTRLPAAVEMCGELGLTGELVAPAAGRTLLWSRGKLRRLPDGLMLGVPTDIAALLRSGLLSPLGLARAGLEAVLPRTKGADSLTVRDLVKGRFGAQVADRLVDPLVGGIHAGWTGELGASEVVPQIVSSMTSKRSLLVDSFSPRARRRAASAAGSGQAAPGGAAHPMFLTPRDGLGRLVEVLHAALVEAGVGFVDASAESVNADGDGVRVEPLAGRFDAAVVTTPADVTARLTGAPADSALANLPVVSVALVTASLPGVELPAGFNGFLAPREEGLLTTACSFASNKWPHWSEPGRSLVRISCGRRGDNRFEDLDDETLVGRLAEEMARCLGRPVDVGTARVSRWTGAFPQYLVGHSGRMLAAEEEIRSRLPRVALAGSSFNGVGIPACIASGRKAARAVISA
jgi:oxygen-dependent protoporphyrinogen oxidase